MSEPISLVYDLHHLPTVQHRAGLGGLAFLLESMTAPPPRKIERHRLQVELDRDSLGRLLGFLYQDIEVERQTTNRPKGDDFIEVEVRQRDGKIVKKFQYKDRRPQGAWLSACGYGKDWLDLWQDSIWSTLRDKSASREIYTGSKTKLIGEFWKAFDNIRKGKSVSMELASALYIGGRSKSNEEVRFDGSPQNVFLLHFAHAIAQPFKVIGINAQGDQTYPGVVWVYLEPRELKYFASEMREYLGTRRQSQEEGVGSVNFYSSTRVTMPQEAGLAVLDLLRLTRNQVNRDAIAGAFCAQLEKVRNNVNLLGMAHLPVDERLLSRYRGVVKPIGNYALRRLVLTNLFKSRPLYRGAGKLLSYLPSEITLALSEEGQGFSSNAHHLLKNLPQEKGYIR